MAASVAAMFTNKGSSLLYPCVGSLIQVPRCHLNHYPNWKMIKEVKHRKAIKQYTFERVNINAMRKNKILPQEIREIADKDIAALPRMSSITMLNPRCMITSRPRGLVHRWRLSRIMWREQADYNKLSGIQRAMW